MQKKNIKIEEDLQQIANMLLLNGTLTQCPGLVHGKMGIAIFFFHYALFTGNELFADYAMDVIGEMLDQIHVNSPADYERGIAGIGVGIDNLIFNDFLSVEDDICEGFDQRMFRAVMYDPYSDFTLYGGLIGYGQYWITRLRYQESTILARKCLSHITVLISERFSDISITEQTDVFCFLCDLQKISGFDDCFRLLDLCQRKWNLQSLSIVKRFSRLGDSMIGNFIRAYQCNRYFNDVLQDEFDIALRQIPNLDIGKAPTNAGILNGYSGEGMLRMLALGQANISWMHLL